MTDGLSLLQIAIVNILKADATLAGMVTGIFDFVPDNQDYPFIQVGEMDSNDRSSHTGQGFDIRATVYVWTRPKDRSRMQCRAIQYRIYELLHMAEPVISEFSIVSFRYDFSQTIVDPDTVTYHGIQRFRILLGGD